LSFFGNASGNSNKASNRLKYKELTLGIKQTVLERAKNRCQSCSKKLSGSNQPYFHHINGSTKDNKPENIRALCKECYTDQAPKDKGFNLSSMKNIFSKKTNSN
jgi:5-methylcytosine-specific restriction endonuclease McrA